MPRTLPTKASGANAQRNLAKPVPKPHVVPQASFIRSARIIDRARGRTVRKMTTAKTELTAKSRAGSVGRRNTDSTRSNRRLSSLSTVSPTVLSRPSTTHVARIATRIPISPMIPAATSVSPKSRRNRQRPASNLQFGYQPISVSLGRWLRPPGAPGSFRPLAETRRKDLAGKFVLAAWWFDAILAGVETGYGGREMSR